MLREDLLRGKYEASLMIFFIALREDKTVSVSYLPWAIILTLVNLLTIREIRLSWKEMAKEER